MLTFILVGDIMADVIKGNLVINTKMSVEDAKRQLDDLQKQLNKLSIPENLSEKLSSNFTALGKELDTLQKKLNTSFKTKGDISSFSKTAQNIQNLYNNLANTIGKVRDLGSKAFANIDMPEVNAAKEKVPEKTGTVVIHPNGSGGMGGFKPPFRESGHAGPAAARPPPSCPASRTSSAASPCRCSSRTRCRTPPPCGAAGSPRAAGRARASAS